MDQEPAEDRDRAASQRALDECFMAEALAEARQAAAEGEVPIGAVVVHEGAIIARAHNRRERDADPSAHAEFAAMLQAARALGRWRLTGCTVYVTLEPCCMCAGLMVNARIDRCVYGAVDSKGGALGTLYQLADDPRLNHAFPVTAGVMEAACADELRRFFRALRGHAAEADAPAEVPARGPLGNQRDREVTMDHVDTHDAVAEFSPINDAGRTRPAVARGGRSLCAVLAIDSFKGSATSAEAEAWVAEGIRHAAPGARVVAVPVADGGEGTLDALAAARTGDMRTRTVTGPLGAPVEARYLALDDVAVIEMAQAAGITLSPCTPQAARAATTHGVGELVLDAVAQGARTVYITLGGSATNDGGAGFLQALGAQLLDADGAPVPPGLAGLENVASIDLAPAARALAGVQVIALSDVTNPLVGPKGALAIFGAQKGLADEAERKALDAWMIRYGALLDTACRAVTQAPFGSLAGVPGAGAAGGLGAAVLALGGTMRSGIDAVLDLAGFDQALAQADFVVTGEGMMDGQTASGKAPLGVAARAQRAGKPVIAVVGGRADNLDEVYRRGIDLVLPVCRRPMPLEQALTRDETRANLIAAGETAARAYLIAH